MWKLLILCMLPCYLAESDGMFECGAHGRFEYCIDGIPGCVIGCHCHPGYYFDTETKICEPNIKLTHNYRRLYIPEPTRIQNPTSFTNFAQTERMPVLTTHNAIDQHVNDITNNVDDLGDWLYNQFFKTIENQVINKTNKNQFTRRAGRGSVPKHYKPKRRARRRGNKHKKRARGLREKLLRITEDDSLFQSSETSDSDSSSRDSASSDSSFDSNSDEDHGHKKIVLINKKPKPPLPSFIFLPNINTPYYPPIGLPPPPVMPMYPMVPVPPMMPPPPLLTYPGQIPECEENITSATAVPTTVSTTKVIITTQKDSTVTVSVNITTTGTDASSTKAPGQRSRYRGRKRKKLKQLENLEDEYEELPSDVYDPARQNRQKLMQLIHQKLNYPRIDQPSFKRLKKPHDIYINQIVPPETLVNNDLTDNVIPKNENLSPTNLENASELENVDFKYLSQLIHRVNENKTQNVPVEDNNVQNSPTSVNPRIWPNKRYRDFNVPLDFNRRMIHYNNASRNSQLDDSYYSNLGKQIATLIRTIDADKERQFNIEIEKVQQEPYNHPYFNENGARTFWERSVRSPLRFFHSFKNRFDNLKNSNELLFNIENKVETAASTVPTLSLHELENLINVMETARTRLQSNNKINNIKPFTKTLNVNLWPQEIKQSKKSIKSSAEPNVFKIKRRKINNYSNSTGPEILNSNPNNIRVPNVYPFPNQNKFAKTNDVFNKRWSQGPPALVNVTKMYSQPIFNLKGQKVHSSAQRPYIMNPTILNYKNIKKYFFDNSNQYSFQNDESHLHYLPKANKQQIESLIPPPYFHHEINHIDYIS